MDLAVVDYLEELSSDRAAPRDAEPVEYALRERRGAARRSGSSLQVVHASVRPGCPVAVVDISQAGVQVECERPLRPGTRVHVRVVTGEWTIAVSARVLRCSVSTLHPELGVRYRGALRFEEQSTCSTRW